MRESDNEIVRKSERGDIQVEREGQRLETVRSNKDK